MVHTLCDHTHQQTVVCICHTKALIMLLIISTHQQGNLLRLINKWGKIVSLEAVLEERWRPN